MRDLDIRKVLHSHLDREYESIKDTVIVDELSLCSGLSRIDIAVINGVIHGYEIKSEEDTLTRLPIQMNNYNKSLEKISIATNKNHLNKIMQYVPEWWGIILLEDNNGIELNEIRKAEKNPIVEGISLLHLLWKEELISVAQKYNLKINKSGNKIKMREKISDALDLETISNEIRDYLKSRQNWKI